MDREKWHLSQDPEEGWLPVMGLGGDKHSSHQEEHKKGPEVETFVLRSFVLWTRAEEGAQVEGAQDIVSYSSDQQIS